MSKAMSMLKSTEIPPPRMRPVSRHDGVFEQKGRKNPLFTTPPPPPLEHEMHSLHPCRCNPNNKRSIPSTVPI